MPERVYPHRNSDDDDRVGRRRSPRKYLQAQVQFGHNGKRARVRLIDLSRHGARLNLIHSVKLADTFWVSLPGLAPISAKVSWVDGFMIGCEFAEPLHAATFDNLMCPNTNTHAIDRRKPKFPL